MRTRRPSRASVPLLTELRLLMGAEITSYTRNLRVVHFLSTSYPHIVDKFFVPTRYEGWKKKKKNPAKLLDFAGFYEYN